MNWFSKKGERQRVEVAIRPMTLLHLPEVIAIDRHSNPLPGNERLLREFLKQCNCGAVVADRSGLTVGYALYQYRRTVLQITLAVHRDYRRGGVGTQLVDYLRDRLDARHRPQIMGLVSSMSVDAQLFFQAKGFEMTGVFTGHHFSDGNDKFCFRYRKESNESI